MESAQELEMIIKDKRKKALEHWLNTECRIPSFVLQPMMGDASMRRYFRLTVQDQSYVVMDAPPPQENVRPFIAVAAALRQLAVQTPEIMHADKEQGFLLLTDFGDATYLKTLVPDNADELYARALKTLAIIQSCKAEVPPFTADFMHKEWTWHKEWVLEKWLGLSMPSAEVDACYECIVESAINQPQVFMHRDYHSANLMVLTNGNVGVLDFQDAFIGPITYDVVSLLRDCYIDWPQERVQHWALTYLRLLNEHNVLTQIDDETFLRWFDLMGMQRQLKALLTFARKHVRDQQSHYLNYVPRTLSYLLTVMPKYPELNALYIYLNEIVQPAIHRVMK